MKPFMSVAFLIEVTLLSFFLALWITWLGLRGLFRLLPAASRAASPVRFARDRQAEYSSRRAA